MKSLLHATSTTGPRRADAPRSRTWAPRKTVLVGALWILTVACAAEPPGTPLESGSVQDVGGSGTGTEALSLTENSDTALTGEFASEAGTAHFDSQFDATGQAVSVVVIGETTIEWRYDNQSGRVTVDGRGSVLTEQSLTVFAELSKQLYAALDAEGTAKGRLPTHKGVLAAQVSWLAAGQPGTVIDAFSSGPSGTVSGEVAYASFTDDGVTCLRKGVSTRYWAKADGGNSRSAYFVVNDTQSCNGSVKGCGNWSGSCMGQCGEGCQSSWKNGSFQDCFDHDFCTYFYRDCGAQFRDAADDYAASLFDRCN
ncbi:MAG TPA: hypothetical protein VFQ61_06790 [Polyangiaceae bacterium]|nr:hypothetical protein [Polyangiaceae bacterium]